MCEIPMYSLTYELWVSGTKDLGLQNQKVV